MWEGRDGFCHYLRERLNASIRILSKHHYTSEVVPLFLSPLFLTWAGGIHATLQRLRADKAGWPACLLLIIITIFNFEFERTFCKGWKPPGNSIYFFIIIITLFFGSGHVAAPASRCPCCCLPSPNPVLPLLHHAPADDLLGHCLLLSPSLEVLPGRRYPNYTVLCWPCTGPSCNFPRRTSCFLAFAGLTLNPE